MSDTAGHAHANTGQQHEEDSVDHGFRGLVEGRILHASERGRICFSSVRTAVGSSITRSLHTALLLQVIVSRIDLATLQQWAGPVIHRCCCLSGRVGPVGKA